MVFRKGGDIFFSGVAVAPNGNILAVGDTRSDDSRHSQPDAVAAMFSSDGRLLWKKTFGGSGWDSFRDVTLSPDGNFIAVGDTDSTDGDFPVSHEGRDALIVKISDNGKLIWAMTIGGSLNEDFYSVTVGSGGNIWAVGSTSSFDGDIPQADRFGDALIVKLTAKGKLIWAKAFGGSDCDVFRSVAEGPDGSAVAVGYSFSTDGDFPSGPSDMNGIAAKVTATGQMVWTKAFGGRGHDEFTDVAINDDGTILITGEAGSGNGDFPRIGGAGSGLLLKIDAEGNKIWAELFGGTRLVNYESLDLALDGSVVIAGRVSLNDGEFTGNQGRNAFVSKINASGSLVWLKYFSIGESDMFVDVEVDRHGRIVAVGGSFGADPTTLEFPNDQSAMVVRLTAEGKLRK